MTEGGDPRRDNDKREHCECCCRRGVADADTTPASFIPCNGTLGLVTLRRSLRDESPSGARGLLGKGGHSDDFSRGSADREEYDA